MIFHSETDSLIKELMLAINKYGKSKKAPNIAEFEPYFSKKFNMTRNIKPLCSNPQEFINNLFYLQENLIHFKFDYKKKLLTIDDEEENRASIYYEIKAAHSEDKEIFCRVSVNLLIIEGKIQEWKEILYTTGISREIFNYS